MKKIWNKKKMKKKKWKKCDKNGRNPHHPPGAGPTCRKKKPLSECDPDAEHTQHGRSPRHSVAPPARHWERHFGFGIAKRFISSTSAGTHAALSWRRPAAAADRIKRWRLAATSRVAGSSVGRRSQAIRWQFSSSPRTRPACCPQRP